MQGCSRTVYDQRVNEALEFLRGKTEGVFESFELAMRKAAERMHFEQASKRREDMKVIGWLTRRLEEHAKARSELTCIYPLRGEGGMDIWYLIRRGVVEHAIAMPKSPREKRQACQEVNRWMEQATELGTAFRRREETLAIVSGWFRKLPEERKKLLSVDSVSRKAQQPK